MPRTEQPEWLTAVVADEQRIGIGIHRKGEARAIPQIMANTAAELAQGLANVLTPAFVHQATVQDVASHLKVEMRLVLTWDGRNRVATVDAVTCAKPKAQGSRLVKPSGK